MYYVYYTYTYTYTTCTHICWSAEVRLKLALLLLHLGQSKVGHFDQRPIAEALFPHQYIRRLRKAVVIDTSLLVLSDILSHDDWPNAC